MKISILAHNLSSSAMVRTYPIAKVLERHHEVEIIGPTFGSGIYTPYLKEFNYKPINSASAGRYYPLFLSTAQKILRSITGDVIYAFKPLPTSYGVGLLKKLSTKKKIILDIEDWEVGGYRQNGTLSFLKNFISVWDANALPYDMAMERFVHFADGVTVASAFLQRKFGGVKLPHGVDTQFFKPSKYNRENLRKKLGLTDEKIILFAGVIRSHKGVEDILNALNLIGRGDIKLMIVGGGVENGHVNTIIRNAGDRVILVGRRPHSEMPCFLSIADLVVLPQRRTQVAEAQIPAKVFEAMAMEKPIIATSMSDLPEILDGCGVIVEPYNVRQLADAILHLLENESVAEKLGKAARVRCIRHYGWGAMEKILEWVFSEK